MAYHALKTGVIKRGQTVHTVWPLFINIILTAYFQKNGFPENTELFKFIL